MNESRIFNNQIEATVNSPVVFSKAYLSAPHFGRYSFF